MLKPKVLLGWILAAFGVALIGSLGVTGGRHTQNLPCGQCHVATQIDAKNAKILRVSQEKLCAKCHEKAVRMSHPTGFPPSRPLPEEFPLDWKGELTCSSCHNIHDGESMRSKLKGLDFCLACHTHDFFDQMPDRGVSVLGTGHLDASSNMESLELDSYSIQCMTCHDGKAQNNRVEISTQGFMRHESSSMNHPIGSLYEKAMVAGGYRPANLLPEKVILPSGKVSCVSCHVGYSKKHGGLVVTNEGSQLCLTCHDM